MAKRFTDSEKWRDPWFLELMPAAKLLFCFLCDLCDVAGFYERSDKMASFQTGLTTDAIDAAYAELTKSVVVRGRWVFVKNFIKHQKNLPLNPENNCHKSIISKLTEHEAEFSDVIDDLGLVRGFVAPAMPLARGLGKGKGKDNKSLAVKEKEGSGEKEKGAFDAFWVSYPRKVGKGAAFKIWNRINPSVELIQKIISAIEAQKSSPQWVKDGGQFIPHPSTWLNQGRWDDELQVSAGDSKNSEFLAEMEKRREHDKRVNELLSSK